METVLAKVAEMQAPAGQAEPQRRRSRASRARRSTN